MMGNLAAFAAPAFGGFLLDRTHGDWNSFLYVMVGMYFLGRAAGRLSIRNPDLKL